MKRKIIGFIVTGTLIFTLIFAARATGADWSIGGVAGYYSPNFGEINDFDERYESWDIYGVDLTLKAGTIFGITAAHDISPNLRLRGEINSFTAEANDIGYWSSGPYEEVSDIDFQLTMTSLVFSGIYRFSPEEPLSPYVGAGVGQFSTKVKLTEERRWYEYGSLEDTYTTNVSQSDTPIGFQLLGGVEYSIENFLLAAEIKYIIAKADMAVFKTADLSGLSLILGVLFKFF